MKAWPEPYHVLVYYYGFYITATEDYNLRLYYQSSATHIKHLIGYNNFTNKRFAFYNLIQFRQQLSALPPFRNSTQQNVWIQI